MLVSTFLIIPTKYTVSTVHTIDEFLLHVLVPMYYRQVEQHASFLQTKFHVKLMYMCSILCGSFIVNIEEKTC